MRNCNDQCCTLLLSSSLSSASFHLFQRCIDHCISSLSSPKLYCHHFHHYVLPFCSINSFYVHLLCTSYFLLCTSLQHAFFFIPKVCYLCRMSFFLIRTVCFNMYVCSFVLNSVFISVSVSTIFFLFLLVFSIM